MSINKNIECCPEFNPDLWDGKILEWGNKRFIKDNVCTFFYIPINFGQVIRKLFKKIENAQANCPQWLCLSEHVTKWKMNIFAAVDKEIPNAENIEFSGKYLCKVDEGKFSETSRWIVDYNNFVREKGLSIENYYMWYTTCPKCAKKYGKNYVVFIGRVK